MKHEGSELSPEQLCERYRGAPIAVQSLDATGQILWTNDALLDLLGYQSGVYVGKNVEEFQRSGLPLSELLPQLVAGAGLVTHELSLACADGSVCDLLATTSAAQCGGKLLHMVSFLQDVSAQKRADRELHVRVQELQTAVERFEAVLHQMPSAVTVVDARSDKIILSNAKSSEIFRHGTAALQAEGDRSLLYRAVDEQGAVQPFERWPLVRSITQGEVVHGEEVRILRGDASHGYIRVNSAPIRDAQGRIVAGVATYDDVTEQRGSQLALQEQSRVNATLLRIGTVLSSELDIDALMQKLTDEATALCRAQFGAFFYNVVDDRGESFMLYTISGVPRELFSRFPMPRNTAIFAPTFAGTSIMRSDDITKDPRYGKNAPRHGMPEGHLPVRSYLALPVKSRSGEVLGGLFFGHEKVGVFTAADEHLLVAVASQAAVAIDNARLYQAARRAESVAQAEREQLRHVFTHAPVLISIQRGPDHVYEFVNPLASHLLQGKALLGLPLREAFPELWAAAAPVLDRVYRAGERQQGVEVSVVRDWTGDGQVLEKFFNFVCEPYRQGDGSVLGVLSFGIEVTDQVVARRRVESIVKELEVSARAKDEFLATVSHELRTPLNAILGWVRMLRTGTLPEDRTERALETIERNAHVQTQLIEDLLDVSRIISGKLRLEVSTVDLPPVVEAAIEAVRPAAYARGVSIHQTLDPEAAPILGDPGRLQQVVWNLLSNAVKFTDKGGRVQVAVRRRESNVEIIVHDNGKGIEPAFLPHVFERFRQADASTSRSYGGLGLGLAIVRHLVELHGGTVAVASLGAGQGTTFTVTLPMSPLRSTLVDTVPPVPLVSAAPALSCPPQLRGMRVLVIDDEPDARELLTQVLTPCHVEVASAGSVAEALEQVQSFRPHLIVSDIGMPGEDGYVFVRKLRQLPEALGGRTPAVALTAYARIEDRTKALVAGFNMHLPKPVEPSELLVVLASLTSLFRDA